jgi:hypothetical protein
MKKFALTLLFLALQSDNKSTDIAPGGSALLQQVLLTQSPGGEAREITVSYYIWGHPFFVKETIKPGY